MEIELNILVSFIGATVFIYLGIEAIFYPTKYRGRLSKWGDDWVLFGNIKGDAFLTFLRILGLVMLFIGIGLFYITFFVIKDH